MNFGVVERGRRREKGGGAVSEKDSSRAHASRQQTDSFKKTSLIFWRPFLESGGLESGGRCWLQQKQEPRIPDCPTFILVFRRPTCTRSAARGIISITGEINLPSTLTTDCLNFTPELQQRNFTSKRRASGVSKNDDGGLKKTPKKPYTVLQPRVSFLRRRIRHNIRLKMIIRDGMWLFSCILHRFLHVFIYFHIFFSFFNLFSHDFPHNFIYHKFFHALSIQLFQKNKKYKINGNTW